MTDHDQRWKTLLREFLDEFFRRFFPEWAELLDFSQVEWLDKEVFPDPPEGRRRALDLPVRLRSLAFTTFTQDYRRSTGYNICRLAAGLGSPCRP